MVGNAEFEVGKPWMRAEPNGVCSARHPAPSQVVLVLVLAVMVIVGLHRRPTSSGDIKFGRQAIEHLQILGNIRVHPGSLRKGPCHPSAKRIKIVPVLVPVVVVVVVHAPDGGAVALLKVRLENG